MHLRFAIPIDLECPDYFDKTCAALELRVRSDLECVKEALELVNLFR